MAAGEWSSCIEEFVNTIVVINTVTSSKDGNSRSSLVNTQSSTTIVVAHK